MSFWGRLFGSSETTKEAMSMVRDGLDSMWYTDEEEATDKARAVSEGRQVLLEWVKNSQGQNLSRRFLAISISVTWLFGKLCGVGIGIYASFTESKELVGKLQESSNIVSEFSSDMTPAVMLILGFYFAAPHMGKIAEAALTKFGDRNTKDVK